MTSEQTYEDNDRKKQFPVVSFTQTSRQRLAPVVTRQADEENGLFLQRQIHRLSGVLSFNFLEKNLSNRILFYVPK